MDKNNEKIIKEKVFNFLKEKFIKDEKTIIIPEVQIRSSKCYNCEHKIIDLLLISPKNLIGFEIKSASDNLDRLKKQLKIYKELCDELFVIADVNKLNKLSLKDYIGIIQVEGSKNIQFEILKTSKPIKKIKRKTVISLLWNIEARFILAYFDVLPMNSKYYSFATIENLFKKIKKTDLLNITRFILYKRYQKIWEKIKNKEDFNISKTKYISKKENFQQYKKELKQIAKNSFQEVNLFLQIHEKSKR